MKKSISAVALFAAYALLNTSAVYGAVARKDFSLGINFPGVGMRYFVSNKVALELRGQFESGVMLGGLRMYHHFLPKKAFIPIMGIEADYVSFSGGSSKGTGFVGAGFLGAELFFAKNFSVQADFGPAYVYIKDKATAQNAGGLEYVINFGLNYYFGKK